MRVNEYMTGITPSQTVTMGAAGTTATYILQPENLAVISGVMTVIFLALKITETIRDFIRDWREHRKRQMRKRENEPS